MKNFEYIVVAGPTASGKSGLALKLAEELNGEIVNCDSVQVYKGFDIGSAKPSSEEQNFVPHHLFDVVEAHEDFDAAVYARQAKQVIQEIRGRSRIPIVVGGTGLYLRSLWGQNFHDLPKDPELRSKLEKISNEELMNELEKVDPQRATQIHFNDHLRLVRAVELTRLLGGPVSGLEAAEDQSDQAFKIKMNVPRKLLHKRIAIRVEKMLEAGLEQEVRGLIQKGISYSSKPMQSIGYKQMCEQLDGKALSNDALIEEIVIATRQYAKRQETWFRKVSFDYQFEDKDGDLPTLLTELRRHF